MSHNSSAKRAVARGGMMFAAVAMLVSGAFSILMGIVAEANDAFFRTVGNYTYAFSPYRWGWGYIIGGGIVALAGLALFSGATWARGVGITIAALSAIGNFFFIPYYPVWTVLMIALDLFVIWSLGTVSHEARQERRAMEAGAYGSAGGERWASTNTAAGYAPADVSGRRASDMANRGTSEAANRGAESPAHGEAEREQAMGRRGGA